MGIKYLMVDVDGVLIDGRPEDGLPWQTSLKEEFAFTPEKLNEFFFAPHWEDIVCGRAELMQHLPMALHKIAPQVSPANFLSYWFEKDSRLSTPLLQELAVARSVGIRVYLATNQEHMRAAYLMGTLGLDKCVDGIFYSAMLGAKKPDVDFFAKAQAAIQHEGNDILLIDDSQTNVEAALKAGWQAFHWTTDTSPSILRNLCSAPA